MVVAWYFWSACHYLHHTYDNNSVHSLSPVSLPSLYHDATKVLFWGIGVNNLKRSGARALEFIITTYILNSKSTNFDTYKFNYIIIMKHFSKFWVCILKHWLTKSVLSAEAREMKRILINMLMSSSVHQPLPSIWSVLLGLKLWEPIKYVHNCKHAVMCG